MIITLDPWAYRTKRQTMSEAEQIQADLEKVVFIESLGNAGLQRSYDYIVSHVNSTNSQWVKRAGIHALRRYQTEHVRIILLHALPLPVLRVLAVALHPGLTR